MASNSTFKVESSFANRRKISPAAQQKGLPHAESAPDNQQIDSGSQSTGGGGLRSDDEGDDDIDHDPDRFLSQESPYNHQADVGPMERFELSPQLEAQYGLQSSSVWPEFPEWSMAVHKQPLDMMMSLDATVLRPAVIPSASLNDDDPLVFLKTRESQILTAVADILRKHSAFLKAGHGRVKHARTVLLAYLDQLHEIHQAMTEIYTAECNRRKNLLSTFERWEGKKQALIGKINEIQSDSNEEGMRFKQLVKEYDSVNTEIDDLEKKLKALKSKKTAIRSELESSQSVIESKASSYIESLEVIETDQRNAIERLSNSIPEDLQVTASQPSSVFQYVDNNNSNNIDSADQETSLTSSIARLFNKSPTAPSKRRPRAGDSLSKLLSEPYRPQIDATSVIESLKRQVDAIVDESEKQESESFKFQESSIIWAESMGNVTEMEKSLKNTAVAADDQEILVTNLQTTLDSLVAKFQLAKKFQLSIVSNALTNEITTIREALFIITGDSRYEPSTRTSSTTPPDATTPSSADLSPPPPPSLPPQASAVTAHAQRSTSTSSVVSHFSNVAASLPAASSKKTKPKQQSLLGVFGSNEQNKSVKKD